MRNCVQPECRCTLKALTESLKVTFNRVAQSTDLCYKKSMHFQWHIKAGKNYVCGYTIGEYVAYADTTIMREKAITFLDKRYAFAVCSDLNGGVVDSSTYRVVRRKADWT